MAKYQAAKRGVATAPPPSLAVRQRDQPTATTSRTPLATAARLTLRVREISRRRTMYSIVRHLRFDSTEFQRKGRKDFAEVAKGLVGFAIDQFVIEFCAKPMWRRRPRRRSLYGNATSQQRRRGRRRHISFALSITIYPLSTTHYHLPTIHYVLFALRDVATALSPKEKRFPNRFH